MKQAEQEIIRYKLRHGIEAIIKESFNIIERAERAKWWYRWWPRRWWRWGKRTMPKFNNTNWGAQITITGGIIAFLADNHIGIETSKGKYIRVISYQEKKE